MKKVCEITGKTEEEYFNCLIDTLKNKITQWDYFVNWKKVLGNTSPFEKELNLLNTLIGKKNILQEAKNLILEYPKIIKAIPFLLAIREKSVEVLVDVNHFVYNNFDFSIKSPSEEQANNFAEFIVKSGIGDLLSRQKIKNIPDYVTGVEVGLDSNARKNRGGKLMEAIVENFVADACINTNARYLSQATAKKIKSEWNISVTQDKTSRIIDFAINKEEKLYFIETNFYGGGGSKLKSTATEYIKMNSYWNDQEITFIWVTDGNGWRTSYNPLREYFDSSDFLLNLEMLQKGYLTEVIKKF
ncbi:MAG: type II restriction endonuclease [Deltaproteobacteria bacterium]|nr:type II restriction endonuclease [Deltaproteobacteria bacterium]